jgi:hypothetical protein
MTIPFATGLEIQNDWSLLQFRHRSLSGCEAGISGAASASKEISPARQELKQNRAQATFKRNICDAKVTLAKMSTDHTERPRISRIPATNQGLFDQILTSCSPTIHASTL